jgi:hypothetical protein
MVILRGAAHGVLAAAAGLGAGEFQAGFERGGELGGCLGVYLFRGLAGGRT